MPNAQIFGGVRDGDWIAAETNVLVLLEQDGPGSYYVVTYKLAPGYKWIEYNRRKVEKS